MSEELKVGETRVRTVPIPTELFKDVHRAHAYADGYVAGQESAETLGGKTQRDMDMLTDEFVKAQSQLARERMEALAREGILAERMDKAEAARDAALKRVAVLEGELDYAAEHLDKVKSDRDKWRFEAAKEKAEKDIIWKQFKELVFDNPEAEVPTPPRPRLFTTAEKDAYKHGTLDPLFPNEISRGWWTTHRTCWPIPEDAE